MESSQKHHLQSYSKSPPPYLLNDDSLLPLYSVTMPPNHQDDLELNALDVSQPLPSNAQDVPNSLRGIRFPTPGFSRHNGFHWPMPEVTGTWHWRDLISTIGAIFASAVIGFLSLSIWIGYKAYIALGERLVRLANGFR
ncbi:hypothetical protein PVAG01_11272 [Phlyctema vagabunda]|uniref:Uncharacterized protein n=1 Tax=Phlyctema vagabunda TaxID=108571 RepID=A0ABR4P1T7_9HELO